MLRCAITERGYLSTDASRWAEEDVDFVQFRDRTLDAARLMYFAKSILEDIAEFPGAAIAGTRPRLLINGRADVAVAAGAAGVHLTAHPDELTPTQVRRIFEIAGKPAPLISISCHTLEEVHRARAAAVDLILFGPIFEKRVESEQVAAGVGLQTLHEACAAAGEVPVLALGGVTRELIDDCLSAGAKGVAGIRLFS